MDDFNDVKISLEDIKTEPKKYSGVVRANLQGPSRPYWSKGMTEEDIQEIYRMQLMSPAEIKMEFEKLRQQGSELNLLEGQESLRLKYFSESEKFKKNAELNVNN